MALNAEDTGRLYRWRWRAMRLREETNALQAEVDALRRTEQSMKQSLSWRLTAPLRWIDGTVRALRGKKSVRPAEPSFAWTRSIPVARKEGKIIVDCSMTVRGYSSPGMQRVTRGLVTAALDAGNLLQPVDLLAAPPREITGFFRGQAADGVPLESIAGEVFVLLDAGWHYIHGIRPLLARLRAAGVQIAALVHDTNPLDNPELCSADIVSGFSGWIDEVLACSDVILCISETTAHRVRHHLALRRPDRVAHCRVQAWAPGSTFVPPTGTDDDTPVPSGPFILCVGTVEPRKNQAFLLEAMEQLWRDGKTGGTLVIFGKAGWKTEDFVQRLRNHEEWGRRLWWFDGGSDAHLQQLYRACTAVALPSIDEGLSLPLSEAAAAGKPVVLSDIPVFRERVVSGGHFFRLGDLGDLQSAILAATAPGAAPCVVPEVGWEASAREFVQLMRAMGDKP